jgi:hypothetical protein
MRLRWPLNGRQQLSYGLLVPVARTVTASAAGEVQQILARSRIRSMLAPSVSCPHIGGWLRATRLARRPLEVLVFPEDALEAHRVLRASTKPVTSR